MTVIPKQDANSYLIFNSLKIKIKPQFSKAPRFQLTTNEILSPINRILSAARKVLEANLSTTIAKTLQLKQSVMLQHK